MKLSLWLLLIALFLVPYPSMGQEKNDSLKEELGLSVPDIDDLTKPISVVGETKSNLAMDLPIEPVLSTNLYGFDWRGIPKLKGSQLPRWSTGYMYGSHSYSGNLMYGYMASANMGIRQNLGDYWTVDGNLSLQKYSVYYNVAVLSGSVTWHPNNWFSMTAFGAYRPGSFLSPIQIGPAFDWGGFVTLQTDTDVPFGVDVGARDTYDPMMGHQVTPIVQPFVKLGGAKIGIDFGPVIRDALIRDKDRNGFSPIPQPIKAMPQVAPRR